MTETVLLTSATSKTGRAVLDKLVGLGQTVTVAVEDVADWPSLRRIGAADYVTPAPAPADYWQRAVAGCRVVLLIAPPLQELQTADIRIMLSAAGDAGVEHVIYFSPLHSHRLAYPGSQSHLAVQELLYKSALPYTFVQSARYMQCLLPQWQNLMQRQRLNWPVDVNAHFSLVDLEDVAEALAIVAVEGGHEYSCYELAGPQGLNAQDLLEIITQATRQALQLESSSGEQPSKLITALNSHYEQYGCIGNPHILTWILGRPPLLFQQFVERLISLQV